MNNRHVLDRCVVVSIFNHLYASSGDCNKDTPLVDVFGYVGGFRLSKTIYITSIFSLRRDASSFIAETQNNKASIELASSYFEENGLTLLGVYQTTGDLLSSRMASQLKPNNEDPFYLVELELNKAVDIAIKLFYIEKDKKASSIPFEIQNTLSNTSLIKELVEIENNIYNESKEQFEQLSYKNKLNDCWLYFQLSHYKRNKTNYSTQEELVLLKETNKEIERKILEKKIALFEKWCKRNKKSDSDWNLFEDKIAAFLNKKIKDSL